jgi:hypothetical protein
VAHPLEQVGAIIDAAYPADPVQLDPPPPLRPAQVARLEALTAQWSRETRIGGPQPDDTLLYAAPKPPPPPLVPRETPRVIRDWVSRHDPRSLDYDVASRLRGRAPLVDRVWECGPTFDQGTTPPLSLRDASGCVGMATAAVANVLAIAAGNHGDLLSKEDALGLYTIAQGFDHISGNAYPGTSVIAAMKAAVEAGLFPGYLWSFGTRPLAQGILQVGPAVVGIPWDTRLEDPDDSHVITPGGQPAGGHAVAVVGLVVSKPGGPWFVLQQSRGPELGDGGKVLIHHKHLAGLLAGRGEAAFPIPPGGLS